MTTTLVDKLLTAKELADIADPKERLRKAAETAKKAAELAEPHRIRRNEAALQLYYDGGVTAVEVWRDVMDISRALWNRLLEKAEKGEVKRGTYKDPRAVAADESRKTAAYDELVKQAQQIRNTTARGLMNGKYEERLSNAAVAKLAGLTSARMAQLRTSY